MSMVIGLILGTARAGENGVLANEGLATQSRADQAQAGVLAQQNESVGCIHAATLTSGVKAGKACRENAVFVLKKRCSEKLLLDLRLALVSIARQFSDSFRG
ncbi:hypothetical protein [Pseudomonas sp. 8AS]|uniref:hypothetical protein n=1 Tax=Pseudomonas sp. 8AS TaxID=2653163 RepID=UPI00135903DA|nr:hypothetical protein [Pseudomonas sp. 8AS]